MSSFEAEICEKPQRQNFLLFFQIDHLSSYERLIFCRHAIPIKNLQHFNIWKYVENSFKDCAELERRTLTVHIKRKHTL